MIHTACIMNTRHNSHASAYPPTRVSTHPCQILLSVNAVEDASGPAAKLGGGFQRKRGERREDDGVPEPTREVTEGG
jgi:hypothetical protein